MSRKRKKTAEFRYYRMPEKRTIIALLGEKWQQNYGRNIDYLHFHNFLEIGYCYEGRGSMILGTEEYLFRGREFTVIPKNYLHTTNSEPDDISTWEYLFVDVEQLLRKLVSGAPGYVDQMLLAINQKAVFAKESEMPYLADLLKRILDTMREGKMFYLEEAEGMMLAFLSEIARKNISFFDQPGGGVREEARMNNLIYRSLDYISDHYHERMKVSDIAAQIHISETHFRRVFSQCMGMSPLEYINLVRIQSACEYLRKTDEPISAIAGKCGYFTSSTFNRNFQKVMGMSPEEWKKRPENYEQQILQFNVRSEEGW